MASYVTKATRAETWWMTRRKQIALCVFCLAVSRWWIWNEGSIDKFFIHFMPVWQKMCLCFWMCDDLTLRHTTPSAELSWTFFALLHGGFLANVVESTWILSQEFEQNSSSFCGIQNLYSAARFLVQKVSKEVFALFWHEVVHEVKVLFTTATGKDHWPFRRSLRISYIIKDVCFIQFFLVFTAGGTLWKFLCTLLIQMLSFQTFLSHQTKTRLLFPWILMWMWIGSQADKSLQNLSGRTISLHMWNKSATDN